MGEQPKISKKLDVFFKLAFAMAGLFTLGVALMVTSVFPIYSAVGSNNNSADTFDRAAKTMTVLSRVNGGLFLLILVFLAIAIIRISRRKNEK